MMGKREANPHTYRQFGNSKDDLNPTNSTKDNNTKNNDSDMYLKFLIT